MSKKKRVRRDIEKFYRGGRYWDLLRLLEGEGLVAGHAREHQEAWKAVIRRALVDERAFQQFCLEIQAFKSPPDTPDFRFLVCLGGVLEGLEPPEDPLKLKGLGPEAEKLRSKFAAFSSVRIQQEKLRALLSKFIREPDKITRRYFEDVADMIPVSSLAASVRQMGESIPLARRFNQKAAVARGWDGIDIDRLGSLDARLLRVSQPLPDSLKEILLHPFVHNVAVMCRRLAPDATINRAAQMVRALFFLIRRLTGDRFEEVEGKLLINRGEWVEGSDNDPRAFQQKAETLDIEEKVALLSGLRRRVQDRPSGEPDFDEDDFFDDDEDDADDAFMEAERSGLEDLARALLFLHHSLLKDIAARHANLSSRERKELVRVMEPILIRDLDYILDTLESTEELLLFLDAAMRAGCAGTRMALLGVLAGAHYRDGDLRKRAEKYLDQSPVPTQEDMEWLCREWGDLFYPAARSLKPLLVRYQNEKALLRVFGVHLHNSVEFELVEYMLQTELSRLPQALRDMFPTPQPEGPAILRRELGALTEHSVLDPVRQFLACYPDSRLTMDGHLCWLNALHSLRPDGIWGYALTEIRRYKAIDAKSRTFMSVGSLRTLLKGKIDATMLFLQEHLDELATISTETLGPLLDELLNQSEMPLAHHPLLIRLEKVLAQRAEGGEGAVRPLMVRIRQTLKKLAKTDAKTRKPRKSKR